MIKAKLIAMGVVVLSVLMGTKTVDAPINHVVEKNMIEENVLSYPKNQIIKEPKNSLDVLIVGDSEVYSGIAPMQIYKDTKIKAYDLASGGQPMHYGMQLLDNVIKYQKPQLVILETDEIYRRQVFTSASQNKFKDINSFIKNNMWKQMKYGKSFDKGKFGFHDIDKGYRYNPKFKAANTKGYMEATEKIEPIPSINVAYVKLMKNLCAKHQVPFILVSTPSTICWSMQRHNGIAELAKKENLTYYDMNLMKVGINWKTDSRDAGDHINSKGAIKVTKKLEEIILNQHVKPTTAADSLWKKDLTKVNNKYPGFLQ